jgi:hypothetical protein
MIFLESASSPPRVLVLVCFTDVPAIPPPRLVGFPVYINVIISYAKKMLSQYIV